MLSPNINVDWVACVWRYDIGDEMTGHSRWVVNKIRTSLKTVATKALRTVMKEVG